MLMLANVCLGSLVQKDHQRFRVAPRFLALWEPPGAFASWASAFNCFAILRVRAAELGARIRFLVSDIWADRGEEATGETGGGNLWK